jgi:hypothetical protein
LTIAAPARPRELDGPYKASCEVFLVRRVTLTLDECGDEL